MGKKLKGSIKRVNDSWQFIVDIGTKGKRKQKRKSGFKTRKDAEKALTELLAEVNKGNYFEPSSELVKDYLSDWLLFRKRSLANSTYTKYSSHINKNIIPELGDIPLKDVNYRDLEKMFIKFNEIIPKERKTKKKVINEKMLSNRSQLAIYQILQTAFKEAVKKKIIIQNPVELIARPKAILKEEISYWSENEAKIMFNEFNSSFINLNDSISLSYVIALSSGMRRGEILGLKWKNVNFSDNEILVESVLDNKKELQPGPKTKSSKRVVSMPNKVMDLLGIRLKYIKQQKKLLGNYYKDNDLVICNEFGLPFHPDSVYKKLRRKAIKLGIKPISFHSLRHTHATLLLAKDIHPKVISERLGHTDIAFTLNVYSHIQKSMQQKASSEIQKVFL
jgi:integrase